MRIVADTNTVVSGLLWQGAPRRILDKAQAGHIELVTSAVLLDELDEVLHRDKFLRRLTLAGVSVSVLVTGYAALAHLIGPATSSRLYKLIPMTMLCSRVQSPLVQI